MPRLRQRGEVDAFDRALGVLLLKPANQLRQIDNSVVIGERLVLSHNYHRHDDLSVGKKPKDLNPTEPLRSPPSLAWPNIKRWQRHVQKHNREF